MKAMGWIAVLLMTGSLKLPAGETDPAAKPYLERMMAFYEKAPIKMDFSARMDIPGQDIKMKMRGDLTYLDGLHFRMDVKTEVRPPDRDEVHLDMIMVSDGTQFWSEVHRPEGPPIVTRIPADILKEFHESMGMSAFMGGNAMDPAAMLEAMEKVMTIRLEEKRDGKVFLSGTLDPSAVEKMIANPMFGGYDGPGDFKFLFVLVEETVFPMEMTMVMDGKDFMVMTYGNEITYIPKEALPTDTFTYTPPESAEIIEITREMLRGQ